MAVYYWNTPAGTVYYNNRTTYLVFADNTKKVVSTGTTTIDLTEYTNEQKAMVKLQGKLAWKMSSTTNGAYQGSVSARGNILTMN